MIKKAAVIGLSITGAIVGVGFSSGREILTFFLSHGKLSVLFCFLAGVFFSVFSFLIFIVAYKKRKFANNNVKNGFKTAKSSKILYFDKIHDVILFICQISICAAMFAGLDSTLRSIFPSFKLGLILKLALLVFTIIYLGVSKSGVYVLNFVLSILMAVAMLFMFVFLLIKAKAGCLEEKMFDVGLIYMPFLYVGMNIFTAEPLLYEVGEGLKSNKERFMASLFIGLFVWVLLTLSLLILMLFGKVGYEMPMFAPAEKVGGWFVYIYGGVMLMCVITTMISTGYGASKILFGMLKKKPATIISLSLAFVLSFLGFSKIIDFLYPALGAVCLVSVIIKCYYMNKI